MASALRISPLIAAVLTLGPVAGGRAQTPTEPNAAAVRESTQSTATVEFSGRSAPSNGSHATSGSVSTALASMLPKYNPPAKPGEEPADLRETDKPKNGI